MLLTYKIIQHVCPNTEYVKYQLLVIVQWWFNVRKKILTWILENFYLDSLLPPKTGYCYVVKKVHLFFVITGEKGSGMYLMFKCYQADFLEDNGLLFWK